MMSIIYDYSKLLGKIKEKYGTQKEFAKALGVGNTSLSQRLNNHLEWTQDEMKKTMILFNEPLNKINEYFFKKKV